MEVTENRKRFGEYFRLANQLMEAAEKDTLAEVARVLALLVTYYERKHGKISMEETRRLLHSETHTDEEVGIAASAMEYLTGMIEATTGSVEDGPVH